jgi:hypothetical protein
MTTGLTLAMPQIARQMMTLKRLMGRKFMSSTMALKARSDKHWTHFFTFAKEERLLGLVDSVDRFSILHLFTPIA